MSEERRQAAGFWYVAQLPGVSVPKPWPLLLFLHGAGERGPEDGRYLDLVRLYGPWSPWVKEARQFLVVAPQCPGGEGSQRRSLGWPMIIPELLEALREICARYPVDATRMYATGLSLGGFGVWALAVSRPRLFAAIVPGSCAFTAPIPITEPLATLKQRIWAQITALEEGLVAIRDLPVWIYHGKYDERIDPCGATNAYEALGGASRGDALRLKLYSGGHDEDTWHPAYMEGGLYRWLLSHRSLADGDAEGLDSRWADPVAAPLPGLDHAAAAVEAAALLNEKEEGDEQMLREGGQRSE